MPLTSSTGIFYVVLLPEGWKLMALRFCESEQWQQHADWREDGLAKTVSESWAPVLKVSSQALAADLSLLVYAFPRGRVTKVGRTFRIYHGADMTPAMRVSRAMIESAFSVAGKCSWEFDDHERCQATDQSALREVLGISASWPAV